MLGFLIYLRLKLWFDAWLDRMLAQRAARLKREKETP